MPKFIIPFADAIAYNGKDNPRITSGNINLASYFGEAMLDEYFKGAYLHFNVSPENNDIFKYYWKTITYKGFDDFESYTRTFEIYSSIAGREWATSKNIPNVSYVNISGGGDAFEENSNTFINDLGAVISDNYNDDIVANKVGFEGLSIITLKLWPTISPRGNYVDAYRYIIKNIENSYIEIDCDPIGYDVIPVFPVNISINPTKDNNFAYQISPSEHMRDSFIVESSKLTIHQNGNDYVYDMSVGETFVTVPANVLSVGPATYDISVNNSYGIPNTSGIVNFSCVGDSEAPTITGVTQDAFPVISWNSNNQKAWQLIVRGENGIVFDSGMRAGNEQSYKLTNMLINGAYYAEVRNLNVYGYYTDWGTYGFVMNTTAPGEPTNIIVSVTNDYGVAVNCEAPADAGTLYVVRRPSGTDKSIIIGEYFNGFVDYTIPINTTYEYTVRNYNVGYADGEWIDATVNASGIIIRDGRNIEEYINLWKVGNGEFNLISNNIREKSLLQCVGRTYPVKESSEWIESTRVVEVFVPYEVYEKLRDMATNSKVVYLQNRGEFLTCDMEISDQGEYIAKGRITQILLTRIDEV